MADVFISYVEEDGAVAAEVAAGLEAAGYQTWYYERDSLPGDYYTRQVIRVLSQARVVVVILSAAALASQQVDKELILAHEANKSFFPLLHGMSHATFRSRRPDWAMILGATVAVPIPAAGAAAIVPRLVLGLRQLGIEPGTAVAATPKRRPKPPPAGPPDPPIIPPDNTAPPPTPPAPGSGAWYRGPAGWAAGLVVVAGLIGLIVFLMNRADDNGDVVEPTPLPGAAQVATPDAAATPAPSATVPAPTAVTTPGPTTTGMQPATSPSPGTATPVSDSCSEMSALDESQLLLARAAAAACATEQAARVSLAASPAAVASPDPAADCPELADLDESLILLAPAQAAACAATQAAE